MGTTRHSAAAHTTTVTTAELARAPERWRCGVGPAALAFNNRRSARCTLPVASQVRHTVPRLYSSNTLLVLLVRVLRSPSERGERRFTLKSTSGCCSWGRATNSRSPALHSSTTLLALIRASPIPCSPVFSTLPRTLNRLLPTAPQPAPHGPLCHTVAPCIGDGHPAPNGQYRARPGGTGRRRIPNKPHVTEPLTSNGSASSRRRTDGVNRQLGICKVPRTRHSPLSWIRRL